MSDQVRIVEVGPRDGLQNEKTLVSVEARVAFIENLIAAGLHTIEVGSFVSPKAIPQMVNSDQVLRAVAHHSGNTFHVLVPNEKGYDAARAAGAKVIAVFASASEGFSEKRSMALEQPASRGSAARMKRSRFTIRSPVPGRRDQGAVDPQNSRRGETLHEGGD